jgi:hypothetical protein
MSRRHRHQETTPLDERRAISLSAVAATRRDISKAVAVITVESFHNFKMMRVISH